MHYKFPCSQIHRRVAWDKNYRLSLIKGIYAPLLNSWAWGEYWFWSTRESKGVIVVELADCVNIADSEFRAWVAPLLVLPFILALILYMVMLQDCLASWIIPHVSEGFWVISLQLFTIMSDRLDLELDYKWRVSTFQALEGWSSQSCRQGNWITR